jgi:hypothetical protein
MDALDLGPHRGPPFHDLEDLEQREEPLPRLDVRLGRMQFRERPMAD